MRTGVFVGLLSAAATFVLLEADASAFCGFYVSGGADAKLFADATQVVLMREGTRTVLSMQNDYKGPPEKFAMVIPVPVVLAKENVKVLPIDVFDKIDRLGSPRLVEYWEDNPCRTDRERALDEAAQFGLIGLLNTPGGGDGTRNKDLGVKVEAKFTVGEYEIVILSAKDSGGLDTWLKQESYNIPNGAEPYLKPYVTAGMKFFVAKVDTSKVKMENGRAALSPIRFHYDSAEFSLPVRLGLINSSGTQDLIVNILAQGKRYEVANYPNVTIPTNLDVAESARSKFGEFYAALFDKTVERTKNAVVTEYSWDAGSCDPCPGPTLDGNDVATLGADVMPSGTTGLSAASNGNSVSVPVPVVASRGNAGVVQDKGVSNANGKLPPEVIRRIVRSNLARFRVCYEAALVKNPNLSGDVDLKFVIDRSGAVSTASLTGSSAGSSTPPVVVDATMQGCFVKAITGLSFPKPDDGIATVTYSFGLSSTDASAPVPPQPPPSTWGRGGGSAGSYVLTRLHARYSKDSLGQDLIFKVAPAIEGGRENRVNGRMSELERGATASSTNNFQARYAIRHLWTGPMECKNPVRGRWGGPPAAADAGPPGEVSAPMAAQKTAFAPRGQLSLAMMLSNGAAEDVFAGNTDGGMTYVSNFDGSVVSDVADASTLGNDGGASSTTKRGCAGCTSASTRSSEGAISFALAALFAGALARRRRR